MLLEATDEATPRAILGDGSYTTASTLHLNGETSLRAEHCLVTEPRKRIRLVQHLKATGEADGWQLHSVEMHHEHYDGPYNGGASLSGCGGGMSNFAESDRLHENQLRQKWRATSGKSYAVTQDDSLQEEELPSRCSWGTADRQLLTANTQQNSIQ